MKILWGTRATSTSTTSNKISMFLSREVLAISGERHNSLFPLNSVIKCMLLPFRLYLGLLSLPGTCLKIREVWIIWDCILCVFSGGKREKVNYHCFEVTLPEKISESFSHYCITVIRKFQQKTQKINNRNTIIRD